MDFEKGALVFTSVAFHMHSICIAFRGYWLVGETRKNHKNDMEDRDDAVKAFLIIAYLLYLVGFILQVIMKTGGDLKLSKKIIGIILFILLLLAGLVLHPSCSVYEFIVLTFTVCILPSLCLIMCRTFEYGRHQHLKE